MRSERFSGLLRLASSVTVRASSWFVSAGAGGAWYARSVVVRSRSTDMLAPRVRSNEEDKVVAHALARAMVSVSGKGVRVGGAGLVSSREWGIPRYYREKAVPGSNSELPRHDVNRLHR